MLVGAPGYEAVSRFDVEPFDGAPDFGCYHLLGFTLQQFFSALLIFMDLDQLSIQPLKGASIVFALDLGQMF